MAEDDDLGALVARIPERCDEATHATQSMKCCCGRTDCAYLAHNSSALDDLEKEVRRAGQLGQVRELPFHSLCFCACAARSE
jgi:hypothetical protein